MNPTPLTRIVNLQLQSARTEVYGFSKFIMRRGYANIYIINPYHYQIQ